LSWTPRRSDARVPLLRLSAIWISGLLFVACSGKPEVRLPEGPPTSKALELVGSKELKALQPEGRTLLVALWATWCEPCLREFPVLDAFAKTRTDLTVIGVATEDPASPVAAGRIDAVFERLRPTYPQVRIRPGGEHELLTGFGLEWDGVLPKTFVVLPDGRARLIDAYDRPTLEAEFRRLESSL
jgi:thiol-disulfide isomerase/thioredoxin